MAIDSSGFFFYPVRSQASKQMQMPRTVVSEVFIGGINNQSDAQYIKENQAVVLKNTQLNRPGFVTKREGYSVIMQDAGASYPGRALLDFKPDDGQDRMVLAVNGEWSRFTTSIAAGITPSAWTKATGATMTRYSTPENTFVIQADNKAFIFNGNDYPMFVDSAGAVTHVESGTTLPPPGTCAEYMNQRLYVAGNESNPNYVYYSDPVNILEFDQTLNVVKFDVGRDSEIVALKKRRNNELIVWLDNAIEMLSLDFGDGTLAAYDLTGWSRRILEPNVGLGARDSVVEYGDDAFFMDDEGKIRVLGRTVTDVQRGAYSNPISDMIRETIPGRLNLSMKHISQAIIHDNKFIIAIPTGTSTYNNTIMVFDLRYGAWTGEWTGVSVAKWLKTDIKTAGVEKLYFAEAGNYTLRMHEMLDGQFVDGRQINDSEPVGSDVEFEVKTKAYDFGAPSSIKMWFWLEVEASGVVGGSADIYIQVDDAQEELVGSMSLQGSAPPELDDDSLKLGPPALPLSLVDQPRVRARFHLQNRTRGISASLVIRNADQYEFKLIAYRFGAIVENVELE